MNQRIISREKLQSKFRRVREWLGQCGLPWAWLSLDGGDNRPVTFCRYVCAALDKIVCGIAKDTEYVWASPEMVKAHIHLNILIDRLAEVPTDFLLVLDDLHEISEPSILKGLVYLMDYLPARMHLILISRREPAADLARQRTWPGSGSSGRLSSWGNRICVFRTKKFPAFIRPGAIAFLSGN